MLVALFNIAWNTGSRSPGELEMTRSTSEVAASRSNASASFFPSPELDARLRPTRFPAFVLVERSLRPCVWLFALLRAKVTLTAGRSTRALPAADIQNITRQGRWVRPFTAVSQAETEPVKPSG